MVIYDSIDSDNLMNAMDANLNNAKELFSRLTKGSAHLVEFVDSGVLSSAANTAGRDLFKAYIDPMIQNLSNAINDIESDLAAYRTAEGMPRQYENHLDEDILKTQLNATKNLIRLVQKKIDDDKDLMKNLQLAAHGNFSSIGENLGNLPGLDAQLENLEQSKKIYEQQIAALTTFESSTATLFTDSLQSFKYALQGVDVINQSKASANGMITFPANSNMKWLNDLKGQNLDSKLSSSNSYEKLLNQRIKELKRNKTLTSEEKTKELEKIYEDYLYMSNKKAFDSYWYIRSKYDDWGKAPEQIKNDAENELGKYLQASGINIKEVAQNMAENAHQIQGDDHLDQVLYFYNTVKTGGPFDIKNQALENTNYSVWSRKWEKGLSSDYLGNY